MAQAPPACCSRRCHSCHRCYPSWHLFHACRSTRAPAISPLASTGQSELIQFATLPCLAPPLPRHPACSALPCPSSSGIRLLLPCPCVWRGLAAPAPHLLAIAAHLPPTPPHPPCGRVIPPPPPKKNCVQVCQVSAGGDGNGQVQHSADLHLCRFQGGRTPGPQRLQAQGREAGEWKEDTASLQAAPLEVAQVREGGPDEDAGCGGPTRPPGPACPCHHVLPPAAADRALPRQHPHRDLLLQPQPPCREPLWAGVFPPPMVVVTKECLQRQH